MSGLPPAERADARPETVAAWFRSVLNRRWKLYELGMTQATEPQNPVGWRPSGKRNKSGA
jgi:hypothetical protein